MKYFSGLKTSERIALSFSLFGFVSLIVFLVLINITYFFIWYADQQEMSFSSMEKNYAHQSFDTIQGKEVQDFRAFLLTQDTIIIPDEGELVCSPGVQKKIKEDPDIVKDRYFYRDGETIYFIYSKYFQGIGEVKVLFDTTTYIHSQIIIIKTGLIFIFLVFILQFFGGRIISRKLLKNLMSISDTVQKIDINTPAKERIFLQNLPDDDEIKILANGLNSSYDTIDKQTEKLKQFLTDVSHEFKTPLMGMSSRLDVLEKKSEKKSLSDGDVEKFFTDTRQNIGKLNGLLESLFFLSRIEEEEGCLIKTKVAVKEIFEKRLIKIGESFPHKKLEYTLNIDDTLEYQVEENTFCILIDNLLSNAMKFAPENMEIHVKADEKKFFVKDNGPGISEENREKIWEKFYRKDTNKEGFGVGLFLVKRIIDIYDWSISVDSGKGKGTKFKVELKG